MNSSLLQTGKAFMKFVRSSYLTDCTSTVVVGAARLVIVLDQGISSEESIGREVDTHQ